MVIAATFGGLYSFIFLLGILNFSLAQWSNDGRMLTVSSPWQQEALMPPGRRFELNPQQSSSPWDADNRLVVPFNGWPMRSFFTKQGQTILIQSNLMMHQIATVPPPTLLYTQPIPHGIYSYLVVDEDLFPDPPDTPDVPDVPDAPDIPSPGSRSAAVQEAPDPELEAQTTTTKTPENVTNMTYADNTSTAIAENNKNTIITKTLETVITKNVSPTSAVIEKPKDQSATAKQIRKDTTQDKNASKKSTLPIKTESISHSIADSLKSSSTKTTSISSSSVLDSERKIIVSDSISNAESNPVVLGAVVNVATFSSSDAGIRVNPGDYIVLEEAAQSTNLVAHSQATTGMQSNTRVTASPNKIVENASRQISGITVEPSIPAGLRKDEGTTHVFTDVHTSTVNKIQIQTRDVSNNAVLLSDKTIRQSQIADTSLEAFDQKKPLTNVIKSAKKSFVKPFVSGGMSNVNTNVVPNALNKVRRNMFQDQRKNSIFFGNSFVRNRQRASVQASSQRRSRTAFVRYWRNILKVLSNLTAHRPSVIHLVRAKAKNGRNVIVVIRRPKPSAKPRQNVPVYIH